MRKILGWFQVILDGRLKNRWDQKLDSKISLFKSRAFLQLMTEWIHIALDNINLPFRALISYYRLGLNEFFKKFLVVLHWIDPPKNSQNFVEKAYFPDTTPLNISWRTHSILAWFVSFKLNDVRFYYF